MRYVICGPRPFKRSRDDYGLLAEFERAGQRMAEGERTRSLAR